MADMQVDAHDNSKGSEEALFPIAVLIDELKHDDVSLRLNAIRRLSTIALALGPARTRDELLPFLDESIDDEDEVLLALADELGRFVDFLGGANHAHLLLPPLETLAAVEETTVRDKAAESLNKIVPSLNAQQLDQFYIPMVKRLTLGDWFTSRSSACALYPAVYATLPAAAQEDMRKHFAQLCGDDTPMVRRAAASNLSKFTKQVTKEHAVSDVLPLFKNLAGDDQDSVRLLTVEVLIAIAEVLGPKDCKVYLLDTLKSLSSDKSWRVRYMIADKYVNLAKAVGDEIIKEELIQTFVHILKDNEAEVRTASGAQIPGFCVLIDQESILKYVLPCVKNLVADSSQHVRASLATQVSGLAPLLGKEHTIEHLLPLFLQLLKDESPDVRLNIISKLDKVNDVIGIELLSQSLLPAIVELAEDKQWRVRLAIIENIPLLASQLGKDFFDEKLGILCMSWLGDPVFSIREAATANLRKLTEVFGVEWAKATIIPRILQMSLHSNYLFRMTTIFALGTLSGVVNAQVLQDSIVPTMATLSNDPIPNIRFNVAKSFETVIPLLKKFELAGLLNDVVIPRLTSMVEDTDGDVRFYSQKALIAKSIVA